MRLSVSVISSVVLLVAAIPAWSASQDDKADCAQRADSERRIRGCTTIIQDKSESDANRASAYNNRGNAYTRQEDFDRAVADLSEAIRLDPTWAGAYINRGRAYRYKGEDQRAIADLTEAIRLEPRSAAAHYERGRTHSNVGDVDRAMADFSEAIRIDPAWSPFPYLWRGRVYRGAGELDRAISEFTEAIRIDPTLGISYLGRGQAYFQRGAIAESLADLDQAVALAPTEPYRWFWRELAARRGNVPSRLNKVTSHIDMTVWPAPMVRLFLGQMAPAAVLAAANDPDPKKRRYQLCDVNFFGAELALLQGRKDDAERPLRLATIFCLEGSAERDVARSELQRLGLRL
jgi:tetratricopeptide (TPR) repeat protein